jgi:hypothetical protein
MQSEVRYELKILNSNLKDYCIFYIIYTTAKNLHGKYFVIVIDECKLNAIQV